MTGPGGDVPLFERRFFDPSRRITRIGDGSPGGKARGLVTAARILNERRADLEVPGLSLDVPALCVLATSVFDAFLDRNGLRPLVAEEPSDEVIALAFQKATLPAEWLGDLRSLADDARVPLACRSSSALEDALGRPFAGVYGTKMIPGNQADVAGRFKSLVDAVKFVFATTFFHEARAYQRAAGELPEPEKMAVVVQEVVGRRHGDRFYPDLSGVARSYNFYPVGPAQPAEGVVDLALGLGKTIVDGGLCWSFSPAHPKLPPPVGSVRDLVDVTQSRFWAVNVGPPPPYDPMTETEYLVERSLAEAEADGTLRYAASTYDADSDRLVAGTGRPGPRVLDFAPILAWNELPLVPALRKLLAVCEEELARPGRDRVRGVPAAGAAGPLRLPAGPAAAGLARGGGGDGGGARLAARGRGLVGLDGQRASRGPGHRLRGALHLRGPADARDRHRDRADQSRARRGRPPLPADRLRPLGLDRPLARHPGALGPDLRGARDRGGDTAADEPRAQPGLALLPQPLELLRPLLHGALRHRAGGRLGLAGRAGDRRPHGARPARPHEGAPRPARGRALAARGRDEDRERMNPSTDKPIDRILHDLQERAKELNCLYRVDELLGREEATLDDVLGEVIRTVPAGWQFPDVCVARIVLGNRVFEPAGFTPTPFKLVSLLEAQGEIAGQVEVYYTEAMPRAAEGPFLAEERKLLDAIAERLGHFVSRRRLQRVLAVDGEPGPAAPGVVGGARLPAPDRPRAARAGWGAR